MWGEGEVCAVGAARGMGKRRFEMYFRADNAGGCRAALRRLWWLSRQNFLFAPTERILSATQVSVSIVSSID